jgi:tripartite-type tricarboxylate transporter receptor subunit TctC
MTLIARPNFPAANFKEFLTYIKSNKDKMNFANAGIGAASHLCGLLLMSNIQADFQTVPFKGTADAMTALIGGQVDFLCDQTTNTTQQIKGGRVKAYGVTTRNRLPSLPDVPTLNEQGLTNFEVGVWHGLWVPKGTPKAVIDKLSASLQDALKDATFRRNMTELGAEIMPEARTKPEGFGQHVRSEITRWAPVIKKAGEYAD